MSSGLAGRRILIPRGGDWGERVLHEVRARRAEGVIAPLIETREPVDLAARDRACAALASGEYSWVFITSASTVQQLSRLGVQIPERTRVAAVGRVTAAALEAAGIPADFLPQGPSSALGMVRQWRSDHAPTDTLRVLVLRGDLAMATVSDELELQGYRVDVGIVYRTIGVDLDPAVADQLTFGEIDAVLLTSGSVARELAQQVRPARSTVLVAIGLSTASAADKLGLRVNVVAERQEVESMLDALEQVFVPEGVQ